MLMIPSNLPRLTSQSEKWDKKTTKTRRKNRKRSCASWVRSYYNFHLDVYHEAFRNQHTTKTLSHILLHISPSKNA